MWRQIRGEVDEQKDTITIKSGEQVAETKESINFGPIDAFHLADLNVLRGRVIKLLLNSPNHSHVTKDLVVTLVSLPHFAFTLRVYKTNRDSKIRPKRSVVSSAPG